MAEDHILKPSPSGRLGEFETLSGKSVSIRGGWVDAGAGFEAPHVTARILCDQTIPALPNICESAPEAGAGFQVVETAAGDPGLLYLYLISRPLDPNVGVTVPVCANDIDEETAWQAVGMLRTFADTQPVFAVFDRYMADVMTVATEGRLGSLVPPVQDAVKNQVAISSKALVGSAAAQGVLQSAPMRRMLLLPGAELATASTRPATDSVASLRVYFEQLLENVATNTLHDPLLRWVRRSNAPVLSTYRGQLSRMARKEAEEWPALPGLLAECDFASAMIPLAAVASRRTALGKLQCLRDTLFEAQRCLQRLVESRGLSSTSVDFSMEDKVQVIVHLLVRSAQEPVPGFTGGFGMLGGGSPAQRGGARPAWLDEVEAAEAESAASEDGASGSAASEGHSPGSAASSPPTTPGAGAEEEEEEEEEVAPPAAERASAVAAAVDEAGVEAGAEAEACASPVRASEVPTEAFAAKIVFRGSILEDSDDETVDISCGDSLTAWDDAQLEEGGMATGRIGERKASALYWSSWGLPAQLLFMRAFHSVKDGMGRFELEYAFNCFQQAVDTVIRRGRAHKRRLGPQPSPSRASPNPSRGAGRAGFSSDAHSPPASQLYHSCPQPKPVLAAFSLEDALDMAMSHRSSAAVDASFNPSECPTPAHTELPLPAWEILDKARRLMLRGLAVMVRTATAKHMQQLLLPMDDDDDDEEEEDEASSHATAMATGEPPHQEQYAVKDLELPQVSNDAQSATSKTNAPDASHSVHSGAPELGWFGKLLSVIVLAAMILGAVIGATAPAVADALASASVEEVNIPIAILIWLMIFPMLLHIDLGTLKEVGSNFKAILVTTGVNYLVQPFTMFGIAVFFFKVAFAGVMTPEEQREYIAGSVILGSAPCTAMVFVWSYLVGGHAAFTAAQVAVNDLIMLVAYIPTVGLLIGATDLAIPWGTIAASVGLFVLVPGIAALLARRYLLTTPQAIAAIEGKMKPVGMVALVLTIVLIFIFQGAVIEDRIVDILLVAIPLSLQTVVIFGIAYGFMYGLGVSFQYAAPGALIASSNFFELAVAVAISVYGAGSSATLATVVGVLTEVPIMLLLVWICNSTRGWFDPQAGKQADKPAAGQAKPAGGAEALETADGRSGDAPRAAAPAP